MFETFRSRATIQAIYFDGSILAAMQIGKAFPSMVQIEFIGDDGAFLLHAKNQAAFITAHNWVYKNDSGRLEWRDTAELDTKWEKQGDSPLPVAPSKVITKRGPKRNMK